MLLPVPAWSSVCSSPESDLIELDKSLFAFEWKEKFCLGNFVGRGIRVDINDLGASVFELERDVIVCGDGAGTARQNDEVCTLVHEIAKVLFLFWMSHILHVPEHQDMRSRNPAALRAGGKVRGFHGYPVEITEGYRFFIPELLGTYIETLQAPHRPMHFKYPVRTAP